MVKTFLKARWENLIMANYTIDTEALLPFLPAGVEIDLYDGKAYVSLVGFIFKRSRIFHVPIPLMGTFEEVNLRFYVKRKVGDTYRRGVVFINETVPYRPVAWLANKLYKEHYITIPTKHDLVLDQSSKSIQYEWKVGESWNHIKVKATRNSREMERGSLEEFIFEHYYGYTKISESVSQEYKINHPRWLVNDVNENSVNCDFSQMYGPPFSDLNNKNPVSVITAEGSNISVDWKRQQF